MIIYGYRRRNKVLGQVPYVCPQCKRNGYHAVVRTSRHFTLFWIPLIPMGSTTTARCNLCGYQEKVNNKQADAMLAQPQPAAAPQMQAPAQQYPPMSQQQGSPGGQPMSGQYQGQYQGYQQPQNPSQGGQQDWR